MEHAAGADGLQASVPQYFPERLGRLFRQSGHSSVGGGDALHFPVPLRADSGREVAGDGGQREGDRHVLFPFGFCFIVLH